MLTVMFAWGNPSRGDDAVGPWFAERYRLRVEDDFVLVEDFQLQVEHLLDCRDAGRLLFVDACCSGGKDYQFEELFPGTDIAHTSHALTPAQLLGQYRRVFDEQPSPAFQLSVPGRDFDLGQAMSPETVACCERAAQLLDVLLCLPEIDDWRGLASSRAEPRCA